MNEPDSTPLHFEEEERLPWLEPIEDVEEHDSSFGRLIGLVLTGLVGIGLVVGGLWWWQNNGGRPRGELIAAPEGNYRVPPPAEPGRFDGDGNVAVAAAEGVETPGQVDPNQLPEAPVPPAVAGGVAAAPTVVAPASRPVTVAQPKGVVASAPVAAARPAAAAPAMPAARPAVAPPVAAASGGGMIQLGAFASEATAARAWDDLKGRFTWLGPVNRSIVAGEVNGRTVYRLRAAAGSASGARDLCGRLRIAGEDCLILP